jgi:hypothetical protein
VRDAQPGRERRDRDVPGVGDRDQRGLLFERADLRVLEERAFDVALEDRVGPAEGGRVLVVEVFADGGADGR